jgi:hypothetical protein
MHIKGNIGERRQTTKPFANRLNAQHDGSGGGG